MSMKQDGRWLRGAILPGGRLVRMLLDCVLESQGEVRT